MKKLFLLAALLFPLAVAAQIPIDQDWARFSRYESENAQVKKQPVAVLFGDSITNNWAKEDNALDAAYVTDAVHPNLAGYKVMEKLLLEVLEKDCRLYEKK